MDEIITHLRALDALAVEGPTPPEASIYFTAARRLDECRALLTRLANDEPAPEGSTFKEWAGDLLK